MGPFQEYEEKKSPQKGSPQSRIPRLVIHPFQLKGNKSPLSDSPFSEEEGKECNVSSDHSKRTISTNSFYSGSEESAQSSPSFPECMAKVKRVRVVAEGSREPRSAPKHKKERRSAVKTRGSEADFSSSSSAGSLKTRESLTKSSTKKTPSRSLVPVFRPPGSLSSNRDAELYAPYRTPPRAALSTNSSSCNSSPTSRRVNLSRYHSCGDNHGIRPPNPEQYLTPLQQKEVVIRHLKTKLLESDNRVHDREAEIEDLKGQLSRMREDWIEEECHRVEAQLSLKEARKEIKQLRQVVETMKSSLMEKDKGIQKYFIDINIQNRKLESLLQSMELAQCGASLQEENAQEFIFQSPERGGKKVGDAESEMELGDQGVEAMADSGLLINDEMANRADILEQAFMSTAVDFSQDTTNMLQPGIETGPEMSILSEISIPHTPAIPAAITGHSLKKTEDKGIQNDIMPMSQDLQALLYQLLRVGGNRGQALSISSSLLGLPNPPTSTVTSAHRPDLMSPSPNMLTTAPPDSAVITTDTSLRGSELAGNPRFMDELDFDVSAEKPHSSAGLGVTGKYYWSKSYLVDLVAVAAPVLPTVAWLYSRHGLDKSTPVNIAALIRGCCIMGLHSLRHIAHKPDV
ncbi:syntabulin isoform X4 [Hippocampus zosterae]|uniref:syntabulin isoform X4 n=1 Tax=Hippocampus zosterae TaxID=109293 RepID=UPI00223D7217|nr:syntabulin isoform X4 [Hippocampus zosterae]